MSAVRKGLAQAERSFSTTIFEARLSTYIRRADVTVLYDTAVTLISSDSVDKLRVMHRYSALRMDRRQRHLRKSLFHVAVEMCADASLDFLCTEYRRHMDNVVHPLSKTPMICAMEIDNANAVRILTEHGCEVLPYVSFCLNLPIFFVRSYEMAQLVVSRGGPRVLDACPCGRDPIGKAIGSGLFSTAYLMFAIAGRQRVQELLAKRVADACTHKVTIADNDSIATLRHSTLFNRSLTSLLISELASCEYRRLIGRPTFKSTCSQRKPDVLFIRIRSARTSVGRAFPRLQEDRR